MDDVDQRRFDNQPSALIGAREAAALLGVNLRTIYAYASRGLLASQRGARGVTRLYRREEVLRLKARHDARAGHGAVAAGALRWGEPVLESAVSRIDERGPWYRGHAAVALAEAGVSFEAAAELLWTGALPAAAPRWRVDGLSLPAARVRALLPSGAPPLSRLQLLLPALAARDPARFATTLDLPRARALILRLAAGLALEEPARVEPALAAGGVAQTVLRALDGPKRPAAREAIDAALVLIADHELNASTFAARIAASAGADLYACATAALATLTGPRHGGACDRFEALVAEAGTPRRAREVVHARARRGEELTGFGHPLYPAGDPRTPPLLLRARSLGGGRAPLRTLLALVDAAPAPPTVDVGLVALALALELPPGAAAALFAVGRTAGWIAHALEQREAGYLLRPRARYVPSIKT